MKKKSFETYATYEHTAKYAFPSLANSNYQTKPKLKFLFWWGGEGIFKYLLQLFPLVVHCIPPCR